MVVWGANSGPRARVCPILDDEFLKAASVLYSIGPSTVTDTEKISSVQSLSRV